MEYKITPEMAINRIKVINSILQDKDENTLEVLTYENIPLYEAYKICSPYTGTPTDNADSLQYLINQPFYRFHKNDKYIIQGDL
jgi:hypothetical protein